MGRRSVVAAISIFVHAFVLVALMTADVWRPISEWPAPRSAMAYIEEFARPVRLDNIEPPKPERARDSGRTSTLTVSQVALAPVTPPDVILPETLPSGPIVIESERDGGGSDVGGGNLRAPAPPPPPATPAPAPHTPVRLHSGVRAPQRLVSVTPIYPSIARSAHVEGVVILEATIDDRGNVVRAQVLRSIPLLDDAALAAVRQWKFSPTLLNGVAVPIVMTVTVTFKLD